MIDTASDLINFASVLNNIVCSVVGCLFLLQIRTGLSGYQRRSATYFFAFFLLFGLAFASMAIRSWLPLGYSVFLNNLLYMTVAYMLLFGCMSWYQQDIGAWLRSLSIFHIFAYTAIQNYIYYFWPDSLESRVQFAFFNFTVVYLATYLVCYRNKGTNGKGERVLALAPLVCILAASFPTIALAISNQPEYYRVAVVITQNIVCFFLLGSLLSLFLFNQIDWHYERSIRDELTGLYNRRYINEKIASLLSKNCARGVIAVVDIDHFKKVNDLFGHDIGDDVLIAVSKTLSSFIGSNDLIGRYGGEEFVIFLPNHRGESAQTLFELMSSTIENEASASLPCPVTISIGYYELNTEDTLQNCFNKADSALYVAKRNGRNCIVRI